MPIVDDLRSPINGAILGCAVGDALGLPYEGLSKRRGVRLLGEPVRHRFVFGHGMVSDDTEHTVMVAQALCASPDDSARFAQELGRRLRWCLLGVPAGIGFATLRAILKLWCGFGPTRSGVFSAGNGPAMRSPILGAAINVLPTLRRFVQASTYLTHTDPKACRGALATAVAAWCSKRGIDDGTAFLRHYHETTNDDRNAEFDSLLDGVVASVCDGEATADYAVRLGCERGVSGYVYRTVPVSLHAWLSHPADYRSAVTAVIHCGGDTDTTAAIVGAIVGSGVGPTAIPAEWISGLWEWPQTVRWMERLAGITAQAMKTSLPQASPRVFPGVGWIRNSLFFGIVLAHIARRMAPPY